MENLKNFYLELDEKGFFNCYNCLGSPSDKRIITIDFHAAARIYVCVDCAKTLMRNLSDFIVRIKEGKMNKNQIIRSLAWEWAEKDYTFSGNADPFNYRDILRFFQFLKTVTVTASEEYEGEIYGISIVVSGKEIWLDDTDLHNWSELVGNAYGCQEDHTPRNVFISQD